MSLWLRCEYQLLSKTELDECVEVFVAARDIAREVLLADIETLRAEAAAEAEKGKPSIELLIDSDLFPKK
jgi:hypothetical protein